VTSLASIDAATAAVDPAVARLCGDLRKALAQADHRRNQAQDRLRTFEAEAEADEVELVERLRSERAELSALRDRRRSQAESELRNKKIRSEIREVESERDAMERAAGALQNEVTQVRAQAQAAAALRPDPDALAAEAASFDAVEQSLRSEAAALRSALSFCERRHQDNQREQARAAEALRRHEEAQLEERQELEEAEDRLRIGRACVADALAMRRPPADSGCSPRMLQDAASQVTARKEACKRAQAELEELHEECGHLLRLNGAAEARVEELEQRLGEGGLKATADRAIALLKKLDQDARRKGVEGLKGASRLVLVLAQICGVPRMAYLALDSNRSGRVSMCEFDSGLRLRFGLDYEAITGMDKPVLRPLFKEFDLKKRGYLAEDDFTHCCPEIWAEYGREAWPVSVPERPLATPVSPAERGARQQSQQQRKR